MLRLLTRRISGSAPALVDDLSVRSTVGLLVAWSRNVPLVSAAKISLKSEKQRPAESKVQPERQKSRAPPGSPAEHWLRGIEDRDGAAVRDALAGRRVPVSPNLATNNNVLRAFAHTEQLESMEAHFSAMPERNQATYRLIIRALVGSGRLQRAADYVERLVDSDVKVPGVRCVSTVLFTLASRPGLDGEQRLLDAIRRSGFQPQGADRHRLNDTLRYVDGLAAKERFVELVQSIGVAPEETLLTMLIGAASDASDVARAEYYFEQIAASGSQLSDVTYGQLMSCYQKAGRDDKCFELERLIRGQGVTPTAATVVALIHAAGRSGQPARIGPLLDEYLRSGDSRRPPIVGCSIAVAAAARCRDYDGLRGLLALMQRHGLQPNSGLVGAVAFALPADAPGRTALQHAMRSAVPGKKEPFDTPLTAERRAVFDRVVAGLGRTEAAASGDAVTSGE